MSEQKVAILGAGHLATAMVRGLLRSGLAPDRILVAAPSEKRRIKLATDYGVQESADNAKAVSGGDLTLVAIPPTELQNALVPLRDPVADGILVSAAAGTSCDSLQALLPEARIVRAMPNLGIALGSGFTGLCAGRNTTTQDRESVQALFGRLGTAVWLDESLFDAVTALAGSGPGFVFHFADALIRGGGHLGLSKAQSQQMVLSVLQSCAGLLAEDPDATGWTERVCSRGGTTEAGLKQLTGGKKPLAGLVADALTAARDRGAALRASTKRAD